MRTTHMGMQGAASIDLRSVVSWYTYAEPDSDIRQLTSLLKFLFSVMRLVRQGRQLSCSYRI